MVYTMEKQKRMNLEFIKQQSNCHVWYDCWHMQTNQKIKNKINFDLNGVQNNHWWVKLPSSTRSHMPQNWNNLLNGQKQFTINGLQSTKLQQQQAFLQGRNEKCLVRRFSKV